MARAPPYPASPGARTARAAGAARSSSTARSARPIASVERRGLADRRAEFELVFEELRRQRGAVVELAVIACPVGDGDVAAPVDKAGIAGLQPLALDDRLLRRLGLLVVALEHAARAH